MRRRFSGLILDWAGVLTTNMVEVFGSFEEREGLPKGLFLSKWADSRGQDLYRRLELGEITQQDWNEGFGTLLGISPENLMERVLYDMFPAYDVMRVAREARAAGVRVAVLSNSLGREFVAVILMYYTGMRWGELVGLETRFVRPGLVRIEWQLYELEGEGFLRCPPKDDSRRDADLPDWLSALVSGHVARTVPRPCDCHRLSYVFRGRRPSAGTRSSGAHWRRSGFGDWIFEPAASGWYPKKAPQPRRPVSLAADPWPGRPLRGRNNAGRAEACWLPVASGLTPHGLRHAHKSLMGELKIPEVLSHDRLGHRMSGIAAVYSHVTPAMRAELMSALTGSWERSLQARAAMNPHSPVLVLDALLQEAACKRESAGPTREPAHRAAPKRLPETRKRRAARKPRTRSAPKRAFRPVSYNPEKGL